MTAVALTPNWAWDTSPLSVDTLAPPVAPPLEWAYLAASAPEGLLTVVDAYATGAGPAAAAAAALAHEPAVVVLSTAPSLLYWRCPPFSVRAPRVAAEALRAAGFDGDILLVGPHGTHSPRWALDAVGATTAWRGSCDVLLGALLADGSWQESEHVADRSRPGTVRVDPAIDLPVARHDIYPAADYRPHMWSVDDAEAAAAGGPVRGALVEASRGCPWSCFYCAKGPVRDRYVRRPAERVTAELERLVGRGFDYVFFIDETFNIAGEELDGVLAALRRLGLRFGFQGRPDLITPVTAAALAVAGCVYVELGVDLVDDGDSKAASRRQRRAVAEAGLRACRDSIPIVRYNRLNAETLDYRKLFPHQGGQDWAVPADPIYPYPGAPMAQPLMHMYNRASFDWEFAEQYSWWLRLEVAMQRRGLRDPAIVGELKEAFLGLSRPAAAYVAALSEDAKSWPGLHERNKAVSGVGGELDVPRTGA